MRIIFSPFAAKQKPKAVSLRAAELAAWQSQGEALFIYGVKGYWGPKIINNHYFQAGTCPLGYPTYTLAFWDCHASVRTGSQWHGEDGLPRHVGEVSPPEGRETRPLLARNDKSVGFYRFVKQEKRWYETSLRHLQQNKKPKVVSLRAAELAAWQSLRETLFIYGVKGY